MVNMAVLRSYLKSLRRGEVRKDHFVPEQWRKQSKASNRPLQEMSNISLLTHKHYLYKELTYYNELAQFHTRAKAQVHAHET